MHVNSYSSSPLSSSWRRCLFLWEPAAKLRNRKCDTNEWFCLKAALSPPRPAGAPPLYLFELCSLAEENTNTSQQRVDQRDGNIRRSSPETRRWSQETLTPTETLTPPREAAAQETLPHNVHSDVLTALTTSRTSFCTWSFTQRLSWF